MAKIHGKAGEWARVRGTVAGMWPLFMGMFVAGFSAASIIIWPFYGALALVLALLFCGWMLRRGMLRIESYYRGARGEEHVSEILRCLPDTYHVFNDFVARGLHVDHVVVGPAGVFSIETKFWRGKVTLEGDSILLNGQLPDRSPLAQTVKEATAVKDRLNELGWSGLVTPVLTFASDTFEAKIAELHGTVIINSNHLGSSFKTDRVLIPPAELERLVSMIENNV